jgi:GAF domain-containing protein
VFHLFPGRGPVVQVAPSWPVTCTATCYAAVTVQDVLITGNYAAEGPHFLDWKALAEQGAVSMAAVPMYSCNRPVAVLCLASKQVSRAVRGLLRRQSAAACWPLASTGACWLVDC